MSNPAPSGTRSRSSPNAIRPRYRTGRPRRRLWGNTFATPRLHAAETVDRVGVTLPQRGIANAETFLRRKAEHADLALVRVAVHVVRRLPGLLHRVHTGQCRMDLPLGDQPVRLPRLAIVREMRADDLFQAHPEVPVVVLMEESTGRCARHHGSSLPRHVDAGAERLPARVFEHDVGVVPAGQLADAGAESLPLLRVLGDVVLPELVTLRIAIDDQLGAHLPADLGLLFAADHADRGRAAVQRELGGVGAEAAGRAPDQDRVALLHARAVARDELAVGGGVDQAGAGGLLPRQVAGLGHELVGLDQRQLREPAEVRLEAPDALLRIEHRVVVPVGVLELDVQAVRHDLVARLPRVDPRPGPQHDAGQVGTDDVVGQVVPLGQRRGLAVAAQEAERVHRLEDPGSDGVVVYRATHQ